MGEPTLEELLEVLYGYVARDADWLDALATYQPLIEREAAALRARVAALEQEHVSHRMLLQRVLYDLAGEMGIDKTLALRLANEALRRTDAALLDASAAAGGEGERDGQ